MSSIPFKDEILRWILYLSIVWWGIIATNVTYNIDNWSIILVFLFKFFAFFLDVVVVVVVGYNLRDNKDKTRSKFKETSSSNSLKRINVMLGFCLNKNSKLFTISSYSWVGLNRLCMCVWVRLFFFSKQLDITILSSSQTYRQKKIVNKFKCFFPPSWIYTLKSSIMKSIRWYFMTFVYTKYTSIYGFQTVTK